MQWLECYTYFWMEYKCLKSSLKRCMPKLYFRPVFVLNFPTNEASQIVDIIFMSKAISCRKSFERTTFMFLKNSQIAYLQGTYNFIFILSWNFIFEFRFKIILLMDISLVCIQGHLFAVITREFFKIWFL